MTMCVSLLSRGPPKMAQRLFFGLPLENHPGYPHKDKPMCLCVWSVRVCGVCVCASIMANETHALQPTHAYPGFSNWFSFRTKTGGTHHQQPGQTHFLGENTNQKWNQVGSIPQHLLFSTIIANPLGTDPGSTHTWLWVKNRYPERSPGKFSPRSKTCG